MGSLDAEENVSGLGNGGLEGLFIRAGLHGDGGGARLGVGLDALHAVHGAERVGHRLFAVLAHHAVDLQGPGDRLARGAGAGG